MLLAAQPAAFSLLFCITVYLLSSIPAFVWASADRTHPDMGPALRDSNLKVEEIFSGLKFPTSMAFLGPDDILVLEKNNGIVRRITNGTMIPEPLLDVNVSSLGERGMLGVAISKNMTNSNVTIAKDYHIDKYTNTYVFLYFTESTEEGKVSCPSEKSLFRYCNLGGEPVANRLYRYELINGKLINAKLLLDLPATPNHHNGGAVLIGPDQYVYLLIGDINHATKSENFLNGSDPDGTGGILRVTQDGKVVGNGILGNKDPINKYYAYGIRNGFGLDFDPLKGNLWDTEDGPGHADEINLVRPGFNSGWSKVQGIWDSQKSDPVSRESYWKLKDNSSHNVITNKVDGLVNLHQWGTYSAPELTWAFSVAPTAIKFIDSNRYGKEYKYDLFVADFRNGTIYHFELGNDRTELSLNGTLKDKVVNSWRELENIIWGWGFGAITDMEVGPDGYLYVLSLVEGGQDCRRTHKDCITYDSPIQGTIFRIVPSDNSTAM